MTDEYLDRLVRDADPYRPEVIGRLDGAEQALLEEIMSVPTLTSVVEPPPPRRHVLARRLAVAATAAAVLTGVLTVSTVLRDHPQAQPATPTPTATATPFVYSAAAALKAAEDNPRLLIDETGWKVKTVYGFAQESGTISFTDGARELEMTWYPGDEYGGYYNDRLGVSKPEPAKVDGWPGDVFTYNDHDFAVMLRPRDDVFVEMRTGQRWTRAQFDQVLADIVQVDANKWLAALPPEIVTPGRVNEEAAKVLADVPLPPNFDPTDFGNIGTNDYYQFGATVVGRVGCAWINEWLRAKKAGDDAAVQQAASALQSSHQWKVLQKMNADGDYPEVFWEYADKIAAGDEPHGWAEGLGCPE